ncbi:unnamed protein product [Durusdinium trenchii]|uniref:Sas10 C-terminal domain-containing protein n=1 Tax=Durusdinium trenchii TaxID=1381693 RepID=A0ABP0IRQ4_9DINO
MASAVRTIVTANSLEATPNSWSKRLGPLQLDVFALKSLNEEDFSKKSKKKPRESKAQSEEDSEIDLDPVSKGKHDFYGGEDAGDDSSGASDEDRTLKEAKKLEERGPCGGGEKTMRDVLRNGLLEEKETLRQRLKDDTDPLLALLGPEGDREKSSTGAAAAPAEAAEEVASARFESIFTEDAEKSKVQRDLSQLSDAKRKSLLKKEAPELLPLLQDFQTKLEALEPLVPLLKQGSMFSPSGASYVDARISLLLNHLANLSFYLMMKAEGSEVRSHPVVSQLVWLRELDDHLKPLNQRLNKKLLKAARQASRPAARPRPAPGLEAPRAAVTAKTAPVKALSLAERLEKLRKAWKMAKEGEEGKAAAPAPRFTDPGSLLQLPGKRRTATRADGPADLDEIDPTLGAWLPSGSLSQQLSEVQQHLRERKARAVPQASDKNPEARSRAYRERIRSEADADLQANGLAAAEGEEPEESEDDNEMIREAKAKAKAKKERKAAEAAAKVKAKVAKQYRPESNVEGRRGTSKQILENRGLVRHRKHKAGNARVANRDKYTKLVKRRKGAVQEMREAAADGATYEGEATGVRTNLRKSLKLG